ncbi:MAG: glycerol-3-phosphate 1-O-acyltransferase PlsY [Rubricoccaceae bacterium]
MLSLALILALSYLLGSVPFSLVVARAMGVDLRAHGSGNAGATNAMRVLGKGPGALVFALDLLKGLMATVLVARLRLGGEELAFLGTHADTWAMVLAGTAAMLGHVFTVTGRLFFGSFKGGKGVATGTGMLLGLIPVAIGVAFVLFVGVVWATRYVSLGSMLGALSLPVTLAVQQFAFGARPAPPVWAFALAVPLFIVWTHRENVRRLMQGTEARITDPGRGRRDGEPVPGAASGDGR